MGTDEYLMHLNGCPGWQEHYGDEPIDSDTDADGLDGDESDGDEPDRDEPDGDQAR